MKHKPKKSVSKENETYIDETSIVAVTRKWHEDVTEDPDSFPDVTEQTVIELQEEAKQCHHAEVANYNIKNEKVNSNFRWMKTIMSSGTSSDKIAASVVSIQNNPVCTLSTLQNIVGMVKIGKKNEYFMIMETLTELFLSDLLKPNRKLKPFHQRPLSLLNEMSSGNAITRRKLLSVWYYEDQLKETYKSFILALNVAAHDSVENNKEKAISAMYKLLAGNPEQEKTLLSNIVNKLGDPSQKVASKTIYCLSQLLYKHPNMQGVVLNEVEKLLFRPNIASRAQYYGLCYLSQFYLSHEYSDIAKQLIQVYFSFFKSCIKKGEIDSRMMSVLLMGINRAYPYAKLELNKILEHINTLYRVVHVASFNVSLHTLCLLYQVSDNSNSLNDRFYSALYKKLSDPQLINTTHQAVLLNLIYKAILKDEEIARVKVFIKRLLQITLLTSTNFSCGILYLISQLLIKKGNVQAFILKQRSIKTIDEEDDGEEKYFDVNVDNRVEVKSENCVDDEIKNPSQNEDYVKGENQNYKLEGDILSSKNSGSWYHSAIMVPSKIPTNSYSPLSRNPLYAGGDFCFYSELNYLKNHYHPSVSLFAQKILKGELITYHGDPLKDFTLIRFLDRFVFKNPKKFEDLGKQGPHPTFGKRKNYKASGIKALSVTSANYIKEKQEKIPVDELFLFNYLKKKQEEKANKEDEDSDADSVASEEFEEMLEKMNSKHHDDDIDDENLDFMGGIGSSSVNKKDKKTRNDKSDDDTTEESDNENDAHYDHFDDLVEDDDFIDIENGYDDDDNMSDLFESDGEQNNETSGKKSTSRKTRKGKTKGESTSLFASAEEFASLLEDEGSSAIAPGSSNAISNKDNASQKQIAWEDKRNRWINSVDNVFGKGTKRNFVKANKFSRKRQYHGKSKFDGKAKKRKKLKN